MLFAIVSLALVSPSAFAAGPAPDAPSGASLDALIQDYDRTATDVQNGIKIVQAYVPNCPWHGADFAAKFNGAADAEGASHKRVMDALAKARDDMNAQAKKIGDTLSGPKGAGQAAIGSAAQIINSGVIAPSKVIDDEIQAHQPRLQEIESNLSLERQILASGNNQPCQTASKMFESTRAKGLSLPAKMRAVQSALNVRKADLLGWASTIQKVLVSGVGEVAEK